jgi:RNA polymerase sigma factor (sigma-70 family)
MSKRATAVLEDAIRSAASADGAGRSDQELLQRFAERGDQDAFAVLFRRHCGMVFGVCRRALPTLQDAEDACQATFLVLSRRAKAGRWQASIANWLYLTARRVSRNARVIAERRIRREGRAATSRIVCPVERMTGRELLDVLDAELDNLPSAYREPLVLCYLEGLTRDEAATRLGVPAGTLKIRLERGRKRLGEALTRRGCVAGAGLLALAATSAAEASVLRLSSSAAAAATAQPSVAASQLAAGIVGRTMFSKSVAALLLLAGTVALGLGLLAAGQLAAPPVATQDSPKTADKMPAKGEAAKEPARAALGSRLVSGRVLLPDGKPAAGVKLFMPTLKTERPVSLTDIDVRHVGTSDSEGRFAVALLPVAKQFPRAFAIAALPGFGVDWLEVDLANSLEPVRDQTLQLVEDVPIHGRIMNTEGKPLAGVTVTPVEIKIPGAKLDDYLGIWKRSVLEALNDRSGRGVAAISQILGETKTDAEGRFSLRGFGSERIAHVLVSGGGAARTMLWVVTRKGFDPKPYNDQLLKKENADYLRLNRVRGFLAPEFTYVAEPGKEITGVITDAATGAPVANCHLLSNTGYGDGVTGTSDSQGRYRLEGLPKRNDGYLLSMLPPPESAYLTQTIQAKDSDGLSPVRVDFKLVKASVVTGRVVDKQTGKGVSAAVRIAPLASNKFFGARPEFRSYERNRTSSQADADGRFRLVTIPGASLLMVQVPATEKLYDQPFCRYRAATPDPDYKEEFRKQDNGTWVVSTAGGSVEFLGTENTVKVIDVKETGVTSADLVVDRGVTGKIAIQDADGKPLSGAFVAGLADRHPVTFSVPESTPTVYGLDPDKPRTLFIYHVERKLGGTVTIRGDEKEPVIARLAPLGRVAGRVVDGDGQPLERMEISISPLHPSAEELVRGSRSRIRAVRSDKDGRFAIDGVLPGMAFNIYFQKGQHYYRGKPRIAPQKVKSADTLDLGDRVLEVAQ